MFHRLRYKGGNKSRILLCILFFIAVTFSPSKADAAVQPYSGAFDYIAYSYVNGINDAPINTAEHFELCSSDAFAYDTIKGDLRLTSDNRIVMCHDEGFTLNAEGRIVKFDSSNMIDIHNLTFSECMALQYNNKFRGEYVNVCDFETYISICARNGKKAFITIRNQYIPDLIDVMMPIIYKYNIQSRCTINSFTLNSLKLVRQRNPLIELSWIVNNGKLTTKAVDTAYDLGNCMLTLYNFPTSGYGGLAAISSAESVIEYAQGKNVPLYAAIVDDARLIDNLKSYGISGAQINTRINHINHVWDEGKVTLEPTYTATGTRLFTCTICGETKEDEIPALERTSIATCSIKGIKNKTYSGRKIKQDVVVKLDGKTLKKGIDYKVSYKNNKKSGKAKVTITGLEKYKDSVVKSFYIKPAAISLSYLTSTMTTVKVKWNKAKSGTGYEIQYRLKGKSNYKNVLIKSLHKNSKIIKKLKSGKYYQIRIRVYKKVGDKMLYSKWSKVKSVRCK